MEPVIYKDELQSLTQKTREKMQTLTEITDSIVRVGEEETSGQGRTELYHP